MGSVVGSVVVLRAGAAGRAAVETLREAGFSGRLDVVGGEPHLPYDGLPPSEQTLTGGRGVVGPAAVPGGRLVGEVLELAGSSL